LDQRTTFALEVLYAHVGPLEKLWFVQLALNPLATALNVSLYQFGGVLSS